MGAGRTECGIATLLCVASLAAARTAAPEGFRCSSDASWRNALAASCIEWHASGWCEQSSFYPDERGVLATAACCECGGGTLVEDSITCESLAAKRPDCFSTQAGSWLESSRYLPTVAGGDCGRYSGGDVAAAVLLSSALTASLLAACCYAYLRVWVRRRRRWRWVSMGSAAVTKTVPMSSVASCSSLADGGANEDDELDEQRPPGLLNKYPNGPGGERDDELNERQRPPGLRLSRVQRGALTPEPPGVVDGAPPPLPPPLLQPPADVATQPPTPAWVPPEWSSAELRALRLALHKYPSTMETNARWRAVRSCVGGGKTKRQCFDKYRLLREKYREEKSAWGPGVAGEGV